MMMPGFDLEGIDWKNPDVNKLFEVLGKQFDQMDQEMKDLKKENRKVVAENDQLRSKIDELTKTIEELKNKRGRSKKARSYNSRKFKGYPHEETKKAPPEYARQSHATVHEIVDHKFCPICGDPLSEYSSSYPRTGESIVDGRWANIDMKIVGRYCRKCACMQYAQPENFLPNEHFGIDMMARISTMRHLTISYGKIQKIIQMFYGRDIVISTLEDLDWRVATLMEPLYHGLLDEITGARIAGGDDTGWYINGKNCWVWVFHSGTCTIYHISLSRSKHVSDAFLKDFNGILVGDSHPAWSVAEILQKCLLHYFRDMYRTIEKNASAEFKEFFGELYRILKSAIRLHGKYDLVQDIPQRSIRRLQNRIDALAAGTYKDPDCNRYVKRLKREGRSLLTFLVHEDVPYHNNGSEQALRTFSIMRKIFYGSRSERGLKTTEIRETIFATCEKRGINPYQFVIDYLRGNTKKIPMPERIMIPA